MKAPRRTMCAAVICLEAIALGLTTPVLIAVADLSAGLSVLIGIGLFVLCILTAGMLRSEWGFRLGWLIQVAAVALGFVVPMMFVLGATFALLWGMAEFLGRKIERERAAAYAAYAAEQSAEPGSESEQPAG